MRYDKVTLFIGHSLTGGTVKRALKVALMVGPLLTAINHAHRSIALDLDGRFWLQAVLTFCVPYLVSTYSSVMTELASARATERNGAPGAAAPQGPTRR